MGTNTAYSHSNLPIIFGVALAFLALTFPHIAHAQWTIDAETGVPFTGYNDIRIPNETGTLFSFKEDFSVAGSIVPIRLRIGYSWNDRNHLFGLIAPLFINYEGTAPRDIAFQQTVFDRGEELAGFYQFNSYRLTYRRDVYVEGPWRLGIGFTAKVRDASVQLDNEAGKADRKDDLGFVPLLHLYGEYALDNNVRFYLEGDGLAGGPGRAVDVFLGSRIPVTQKTEIKLGYRMLEGGANVEDVYNFTLVHFAVLGLFLTL
ncbi:hypothetical protein ADIS_4364 [Lunatimonas lonarensis]|uniref:Outer membrane protein beta-barrel domain-containing protein n=1 Tax=Lunatimonas lonarensis TaxID=1232681 RepID=R7ZM66_9BACT|nr:hypothetical protein [Lunatimonas lonarensis]EON75193.1 hypothetical protein ADIS_4364 [Lunatimonas lonarensis]